MNEKDYDILGFEDEVEEGGYQSYPDGFYIFTYQGFTRGNHAADQYDDHDYPTAIVKMEIEKMDTHETFACQETFKMIKKAEWKIHNFFKAMGIAKNPATGKIKPAWTSAVGRTGIVELVTNEFKKNDGTVGTYQAKNFLTNEEYEKKKGKVQAQPSSTNWGSQGW